MLLAFVQLFELREEDPYLGNRDIYFINKCDECYKKWKHCSSGQEYICHSSWKGRGTVLFRDRRVIITRFEGRLRRQMEILEESKMTPLVSSLEDSVLFQPPHSGF